MLRKPHLQRRDGIQPGFDDGPAGIKDPWVIHNMHFVQLSSWVVKEIYP
jgi:hypothetical protein